MKIVFTKAEVEDIINMHVKRKFGISMDRVDLSSYMTDFCVVSKTEEPEAPVNLVKLTDIEDTFGAAV